MNATHFVNNVYFLAKYKPQKTKTKQKQKKHTGSIIGSEEVHGDITSKYNYIHNLVEHLPLTAFE